MMTPADESGRPVETDDRFPSGPWKGFFLMPSSPDRHGMELLLTFREGTILGEGRDRVGEFLVRGRYQTDDGKCWWTKRYVGKHDVSYLGYNEGKGIWGTWDIPPIWRGGFHIWPEAMGDPTKETLVEEAEVPELVGASVGGEESYLPETPTIPSSRVRRVDDEITLKPLPRPRDPDRDGSDPQA